MKYIVTNFAYGTGPYLRTTELAIALNFELKKQGKERMGIIVPWVYGEKQKLIMLEEFKEYDEKYPGLIVLDPTLGSILKKIFYGDNSYEEALDLFVSQCEILNKEAHEHLSNNFKVTDLQGNTQSIVAADIVMEMNRTPRITYNIAPAFSVTFGYMSEILRSVADVQTEKIILNRELAKRAEKIAKKMETSHIFHALAHPGTFSYQKDRKPAFPDEILIPPTVTPLLRNTEKIPEGIYVTITGIPGLERLYKEAKKLGLKLYSNDVKSVKGSEYLSPHYIANPNIKMQFARSGWGSIWLSQISGTPFVAPDFDLTDDPEIYFNNICIEKLGLGVIYRGQPLVEILRETEQLKSGIQTFNNELLFRFGTLAGNEYIARLLVEKFSI